MTSSQADARLIVAVKALSQIAHAPAFNGKSPDQRAALNALETIRAIDAALATHNGDGE